MTGSNRQSLAEWILEALSDTDKDGPCVMLALVHMQGQFEEEIAHVAIKPQDKRTPVDLATMFQKKADSYSQDLNGVQTFCLLAFYGQNAGKPGAKHPFLVNSLNLNEPNGLSTESPTTQGRMQQHMRMDEMVMQQAYRRQEAIDAHTIQYMRVMSDEAVSLRKANMDLFEITKDAVFKLADMRHEHVMKQLEFIRGSEEREMMMKVIPPLINSATGKEVFPQSTADTFLIDTLSEKITPEVIQGLVQAGKINGKEAAILLARIKQAEADKERRQTARQALLSVEDELEMPFKAYAGEGKNQLPESVSGPAPEQPPTDATAAAADEATVDSVLVKIMASSVSENDVDMLVSLGKITKEAAELFKARFKQIAGATATEPTQQETNNG